MNLEETELWNIILEKYYKDNYTDDLNFLFLIVPENNQEEIIEQKIKKINIKIDWEISELHAGLNRVANRLNQAEKDYIKRNNIEVNQKHLENEEIKIIIHNWIEFCQKYNFDPTDAKYFHTLRNLNKTKDAIKFAMFLSKGLPNRTFFTVFHKFKRLTNSPNNPFSKRTNFSEFQKSVIKYYLKSKYRDKKYGIALETLIGRFSETLRKNSLRSSLDEVKFSWSIDLCEKFVNCLIKVVNKEFNFDNFIEIDDNDWCTVSKRLGIKMDVLKYYWLTKFSTKFFAQHSVKLNEVLTTLIEYFVHKKYERWGQVRWRSLTSNNHDTIFCGVSPYLLSEIFKKYIILNVPQLHKKSFGELIQYLYENSLHDLNKSGHDKELVLWQLQNGKILTRQTVQYIEKIQNT